MHHSPCSKCGLSFNTMALITSDCGGQTDPRAVLSEACRSGTSLCTHEALHQHCTSSRTSGVFPLAPTHLPPPCTDCIALAQGAPARRDDRALVIQPLLPHKGHRNVAGANRLRAHLDGRRVRSFHRSVGPNTGGAFEAGAGSFRPVVVRCCSEKCRCTMYRWVHGAGLPRPWPRHFSEPRPDRPDVRHHRHQALTPTRPIDLIEQRGHCHQRRSATASFG